MGSKRVRQHCPREALCTTSHEFPNTDGRWRSCLKDWKKATALANTIGVLRAVLKFGRLLRAGFRRSGLVGFRSTSWPGAGWTETRRYSLFRLFQPAIFRCIHLPHHQQSQGIPISHRASAWIAGAWGSPLRAHAQPRLADSKPIYLGRMPDAVLSQVREVVRMLAGIPR